MTTAWARRQKRDGGADVKSCQVQSDHLSSTDRQRQSPICEADTCTSCFGPSFSQMFTFSHMTLGRKDILIFYWGLSSSTIRVNSLTVVTPPTRAFSRQEGKGDLFPCPPAVSPFFKTPAAFFCCTHSAVWRAARRRHPVSRVFWSREWAAVSLCELWAQQWESCENPSLTSGEIPSLHPTARWWGSEESTTSFIVWKKHGQIKHAADRVSQHLTSCWWGKTALHQVFLSYFT